MRFLPRNPVLNDQQFPIAAVQSVLMPNPFASTGRVATAQNSINNGTADNAAFGMVAVQAPEQYIRIKKTVHLPPVVFASVDALPADCLV